MESVSVFSVVCLHDCMLYACRTIICLRVCVFACCKNHIHVLLFTCMNTRSLGTRKIPHIKYRHIATNMSVVSAKNASLRILIPIPYVLGNMGYLNHGGILLYLSKLKNTKEMVANLLVSTSVCVFPFTYV